MMMRKLATALFLLTILSSTGTALAQRADFILNVPLSSEFDAPYVTGLHSGARGTSGPYDLDGDEKMEVLVTDYTRGGRVYVVENQGPNAWELVYSTPALDSTASTNNGRYAVGADLDDDGKGEIIFVSGHGFSANNPDIEDLPVGIYVYEHTGTDNDYGTSPASIFQGNPSPDRFVTEQMVVADVDGDGFQELLFANNAGTGFNAFDAWYVVSVSGDIGSTFELWVEEVRLPTRVIEGESAVNRGGGSGQAIHVADLNGDEVVDLSLHSWNYFNFTNGSVTDADTYLFPDEDDPNVFLQATNPDDHVSLFGGVVVDIDGDGNDEVYYPNFQRGHVSVLNYDEGEDVLQVTTDNLILDVIPGFTSLGITAGDVDGDGKPELIGSGPSFTANAYNEGQTPVFLRVAKYLGGDVEDPASYEVSTLDYSESVEDLGAQFDLIRRDSAGVITEFARETSATVGRGGRAAGQGPDFVSKLSYLGDVDGDGDVEIAAAFQGVDDTTYVIQETFNPADSTYTQEVLEARPAANRVFFRILSFDMIEVAVEDGGRANGYSLGANAPNPFRKSTAFAFTLPDAASVSVKVYDLTGRLVKTLVNNQMHVAGPHRLTWDGTNASGSPVASGTYLYTLEYGKARLTQRMVLVR